MWFCFWEAGFSYVNDTIYSSPYNTKPTLRLQTISTISYTLKVGTSLGTSADAAARWAERKARRDWKVYLVWFVDVIAFVLPLSHVICEISSSSA